ncbi:MAG: YifB family Mg chelatase-like AAA ATPase [Cytophagales bacterium]|nr:YifB family Mg chelatase-like AAA ATPase [Cytophagales bacterium]
MSGFSIVQSRALLALESPAVTVEVHLANGLPSFTLVGLAETEVKEARERVRCAIQNSGLDFPNNKRITVNLAPADLPKDSGRFDLAIALGVLAASGQIDGERLAGYVFAGELSLAGDLRAVRGALAMSLALRKLEVPPKLVLPLSSAREAALVDGAVVFGALHLLDIVQEFSYPEAGRATPPATAHNSWQRVLPAQRASAPLYPDMSDVRGQLGAKRALEIAAAGGHSVLMVGTPGSGKSMLAHRFAGLLPPMNTEEALDCAAMLGLGGFAGSSSASEHVLQQWGQRPTRSPHHTATAPALVGGGAPPRPGEISLAHNGVLFLDELPEFPRSALEALREPLESGKVSIVRATQRAEFPARFQLVAAMNPCPCGYLGSAVKPCRCTPDQVSRYQGKLSGPLLDRIDLHIEVGAMPSNDLVNAPAGEASEAVRARVRQARSRAITRQAKANYALGSAEIDEHCQLDATAIKFLSTAATRLGWSGRSTHRVMKIARTIADLVDSKTVGVAHIAEAVQYRRALKGA